MIENKKSIGQKFVQFVHKYNPTYLLSAACMLAGCVALVNDTAFQRISLVRILAICFTLLVYQMALFAIAGYLLVKRALLRDAVMLLILDAIFLSDVTYVLGNLIAVDVWLGVGIGSAMLVLGLVRITWITSYLNSSWPIHRLAFVASMFAMLIGIPAYLKLLDHGAPTRPLIFYVFWWITGLLTAGVMLADEFRARHESTTPVQHAGQHGWLYPTYAIAAWSSVVLHISLLHWVYDVHFYLAMLSPMMLAFAIAARRALTKLHLSLPELRQLELLMIGTALFAAVPNPRMLVMTMPIVGRVSPIVLTLLGSYLSVVYLYLSAHAIFWLSFGALATSIFIFGGQLKQLGQSLEIAALSILRALFKLVPTTRLAWGIISIISSFVLLIAGVFVSLHKPVLIDATERPAGSSGQ